MTELEILVHNVFILPVLAASWVFGNGVIEFVGITCGLAAVAGLLGIKLLKDKESSTFGNLEIDFNPHSSTASTHLESRAPGKPTEDDGYTPPKRWEGEKVKNPNGPGYGYPDDKGSVWIPTGPNGHRGPHWDVEHPDGTYDNIFPGGKILGKK